MQRAFCLLPSAFCKIKDLRDEKDNIPYNIYDARIAVFGMGARR